MQPHRIVTAAQGPVTETAPASDTSPASAAVPTAASVRERIAELVADAAGVVSRPLAEHAEVYQRVHAGLQDALAEIDGR